MAPVSPISSNEDDAIVLVEFPADLRERRRLVAEDRGLGSRRKLLDHVPIGFGRTVPGMGLPCMASAFGIFQRQFVQSFLQAGIK
jgi:hypothetical protein